MTRYYTNWVMVALLGVVSGCAPYDQLWDSTPYYSGSQNNSSNYPYSGNAYGTRYPSYGHETEYRKAQQHISSSNSQAIIDGITQRMLSGGWYPEGASGNQLIFTRVRNQNNQDTYYKTVYTLVPSEVDYTVYANMKLKTMDSPYRGSLDDAAHNVDDKTESILRSVKKAVEQTSMSVTPVPTVIPVVKKTLTNTEALPLSNQSYSNLDGNPYTSKKKMKVKSVPQTVVEMDANNPIENTSDVTVVPAETSVIDAPVTDQQKQTDQLLENQPNDQQTQQYSKQQNKQDKADKKKEHKEQSRKSEKEKRTNQDDLSDEQPNDDESSVTTEPAEPQ